MILYNVTVNIDDEVREEWLTWMKQVHVPDVMKTGLFLENKIYKVMVNEEAGTTYSVQYTLRSMDDLKTYQEKFAPALQKEHASRYANKFVAFRTVLELV